MKLIIIKIPEVLHSRAINGELTDLDTMFICGAVAQSKPLQTEFEDIKAEIKASRILTTDRIIVDEILDNRIAEPKGE